MISPSGYILTNHHLIAGEDITLYVDGEPLEASIDVQRIEVAFPNEIDSDEPERFYRASVEAVDPDFDLALLHIQGANLPYVPLGDSSAIQFGDPVRILGYPLGWGVEVARKSIDRVVPEVTISRGALSAVRRDEQGIPRYLQTDAAVNLGNSGGPVVSTDGFALGVMCARMRGGRGIGFAVPINLVKDFLLEDGFDWMFPVQRLELGPHEVFPGKGLQMRIPVGFSDLSPRLDRVECDNGVKISFSRSIAWAPYGVSSRSRKVFCLARSSRSSTM